MSANKNEKEIQKNIKSYFEKNGGFKILEEEFKILKNFQQKHPLLLIDSYQDYFKGLTYHIEKVNKNLYKKYNHIDKSIVTKIILDDFLEKYDYCKNNVDSYKLIFSTTNNNRNIIIDKKTNKIESYNVIFHEKSNKNEFNIIKEKRIEGRKGIELPDFAIYINGIPLIAIEVKTSEAGLKSAFSDYKKKSSYQKFICAIGTDGIEAFVSSDPSGFNYFKWEAYGDNKNDMNNNGFEDLSQELLFSSDNLMFYIKYCILEENGYDGNPYLMNHRVQQYYTLKKSDILFKYCVNNLNNKNKDKMLSEVVKHVQRSGKSITIKSIVNLLACKYSQNDSKLFSKIYVCVPDTVISRGIMKTFGNLIIHGTGKEIQKIRSRREYDKSIEKNINGLDVFLMNIQKVSEEKNSNKKYKENDVLIIIDEVHTHQAGKSAEIRNINFPNASYMTFTATPRIKESKSLYRDITAELYSSSNSKNNRYLDDLLATDAINLGIILPIAYEKAKFQQYWDKHTNKSFDKELSNKYMDAIKTDPRIIDVIDEKVAIEEGKLRKKNLNISVVNSELVVIRNNIERQELAKMEKKSTNEISNDVYKNIMKDKVDFIINDFKEKEKNVFWDKENNKPYFKIKGFFVVKNKKEAESYIAKIKEASEDGTTTYSGIRFAADFSESQHSTSDLDESRLEKLNGKPKFGTKIIDDFESEKDGSVDILIIVDKYLMGYDENKLIAVYCDKEIREPSKLYQLITRPATARENKKTGFFVDLSFGDDNYHTFKEALVRYDNKKGVDSFILDDEEIIKQKAIIKDNIDKIKTLLKITEQKDINDEVNVYEKLIKSKQTSQMSYFEIFNNINCAFKILVKPEYYIGYLDTLYTLINVNFRYKNEFLNKDKIIIEYDPNFIRSVINATLSFFDLASVKDITQMELIGKENRDYNDEEKKSQLYNNELNKIKINLHLFRPPLSSKSFFQQSEEWSEKIALANKSDTKDLDLMKDKLKKEKERIQKIINVEFNGNKYHFFMFQIIKSKLLSDLQENYNKDSKNLDLITKKYSEHFSDVLYGQHLNINSNNDIEDVNVYAESIASKLAKEEGMKKLMSIDDSLKLSKKTFYQNIHKENFENVMVDSIKTFVREIKAGVYS